MEIEKNEGDASTMRGKEGKEKQRYRLLKIVISNYYHRLSSGNKAMDSIYFM